GVAMPSDVAPAQPPGGAPAQPLHGRGRHYRVELPAEMAARLPQACREHDATPHSLWMAAFVVLLRRWSGQRDIVVGTAVTTRRHADAVGSFFSLVPLRVRLDDDASFHDVVCAVRRAV